MTDNPAVTFELLQSLPKTDLHVHLDGSLRLATILELAEEQGVELPTTDEAELKRRLVMPLEPGEGKSLTRYLEAFDITLSVMQTPESLERVAYELAEDAARENVRYMEVRYSPILHTRKGMRLTEVQDAVKLGLERAERDFNIRTGIIICGIRNISPDVSLTLAELAVAYKNRGVLAFDLAGAEYNYPAKHHKSAFALILHNNINCTLHAGEAYGPESIHQAIHYCGAHRIGHGVRLKEDGDLLNYVNDHRIPLELCLTSNVQTGAVTNFEDHPLRFYFDFGLRVTVNTDNRLMSDTSVTQELFRAAQTFDFNLEEMKLLIVNGFKSTFLPYRQKVQHINRALQEIRDLTHADSLNVERYVKAGP